MAINKKDYFKNEDIILADYAKAVSHPARVEILKILANQNSCICGRIVEVMPLAQSTVSQHLKELKKSGLVQGTIDGPKSCYSINRENFEKMKALFNVFFNELNNMECCR